jgi:DNA-binding SARP family transcriptional activator
MLQAIRAVQRSPRLGRKSSKRLSEEPEKLIIHLLGDFSVSLGTQQISEAAFARRKARQLLKLLALQSEFRLHRDRVLDLLWPELPPESATGQLHKAVHHIRRALASAQPATAPEKLLEVKEGELKLWASGGVTTDVHLFTSLTQRALSTREVSDLECAVAAYRGDLLPADLYADWTVESRDALKDKATCLYKTLAEVYANTGQLAKAEETYQLALCKEGSREDLHRALFQLYAKQGNKEGLEGAFERYRRSLYAEVDEAPSPEMTALYTQLLKAINETGRTLEAARPNHTLATPALEPEAVLAQLADTSDKFLPSLATTLPNLLVTAITDALGLSLSGRSVSKVQVLSDGHSREMHFVFNVLETSLTLTLQVAPS